MRSSTLLVGYTLIVLSLVGCGGDATAPVRADVPDPALVVNAFPTASIQGPSEVNPHDLCTWQVVVTGGTPPYTYEWGSVGMVEMPAPGPSYWRGYKTPYTSYITVTVADAAEQATAAFLFIGEPLDRFQSSC